MKLSDIQSGNSSVSNQDLELFSLEMAGVKPIKNPAKNRSSFADSLSPGLAYRRFAAQYTEQEKHSNLSLVLKKPLSAGDWLSFKRDGVQNAVFRNLRTGKYPLEATLNLNGKRPEQACHELLEFIRECQYCNLRSTLITFGRKPSGILIKSYLAQWLPNLQEIQAFHTAQTHHGGDRALYVLIRKSEAKKAETRERHAARLPG